MFERKFILNADDFGKSADVNRGVCEGYAAGMLKSASIMANGEAYQNAIEEVLPVCPELGVGVHLNVIEGKSICEDVKTLTDSAGNFRLSFIGLLIRAYNPLAKTFKADLEREFRRQIEKVAESTSISHIDSHVHVHAIPPIFELVCTLAKEYGISQVRTQYEKKYIIPDIHKHLNFKYLVNLIKAGVLAYFTKINAKTVHKHGLKTNRFLIGVRYTSMMTPLTVSYGLMAVRKYRNVAVEALIHPARYEDGTVDNHFFEFMITKNKKLADKIETLGFEITNYVENKES